MAAGLFTEPSAAGKVCRELPAGLTQGALEVYAELAVRVIARGGSGWLVQSVRLALIERAIASF
jgi:hypothetical protein